MTIITVLGSAAVVAIAGYVIYKAFFEKDDRPRGGSSGSGGGKTPTQKK